MALRHCLVANLVLLIAVRAEDNAFPLLGALSGANAATLELTAEHGHHGEAAPGLPFCAKFKGELRSACEQGADAARKEEAAAGEEEEESHLAHEHGAEEHSGEGEGHEGGEHEHHLEFDAVDVAISLMLLGAIIFVMTLFTLANYPDQDMRYYCWSMISITVAIFVSVLVFEGVDCTLHSFLTHLYGTSKPAHDLLSLVETLILYFLLQFVVAALAGVLEDEPYQEGLKTKEWDGKEVPYTIPAQVATRERRMKCWATLFAHFTGFAAISLGQRLIMMPVFEEHPPLAFSIGLGMFFFQAIVSFVLRRGRFAVNLRHQEGSGYLALQEHHSINDLKGTKGRTFALRQWEEEVVEGENDVICLSVSFLFVEACRLNITGVYNVTEPEQVDWLCCVKLGSMAILFGIALVSAVVSYMRLPKDEHTHFGAWLERLIVVIQNTMAMSLAWAVLGVIKWLITLHLPALGGPERSSFRVLQALLVSFVVFLSVRMLDVLADLEMTGDEADLAIFNLIKALGFLVGYSWEQSFHLGVEVISESVGYRIVGQPVLAIAVAVTAIVPWRRHILTKLLKLTEERKVQYAGKMNLVKEESHAREAFAQELEQDLKRSASRLQS